MINLEPVVNGLYNFKNQQERLVYLGFAHFKGDRRRWHQFAKVGTKEVWAEILDSDLTMIEETLQPPKESRTKVPDCVTTVRNAVTGETLQPKESSDV